MSFAPLKHSQLAFVDADSFGGGEDGDGSDMRGRAMRRAAHRAIPEDAAIDFNTPEAMLLRREEEQDDPWHEVEEVDGHSLVTVNDVPLAVALHEGLAGDDAPDTLALARAGWFDAPKATGYTPTAAHALRNSEHDGILRLGSRLAAELEYGVGAFRRSINWTGSPECWKCHRRTQYRPDLRPKPL